MTSVGMYYFVRLLVTLAAIPCHEAGHALASWLLGGATAKEHGRLSLNPFAHFDLLGTVCMVVAGIGWAKPVPTDPRRFKNPKVGMALTALAGPVANLLMAYLSMAIWKVMYYWAPVNNATLFIAYFLEYMVLMNVGLAVFNLLPIPPLDGSRVALVLLPRRLYFWGDALRTDHFGGAAGYGLVRRFRHPAGLDEQSGLAVDGLCHLLY